MHQANGWSGANETAGETVSIEARYREAPFDLYARRCIIPVIESTNPDAEESSGKPAYKRPPETGRS
jgi:hypothetical protein